MHCCASTLVSEMLAAVQLTFVADAMRAAVYLERIPRIL